MSDEIAIQQVLNTYSYCATIGDFEGMAGTYTADGAWEVPGIGMELVGREAIIAASVGVTAKLEYMVQVNSPAVIKVDGDRATAHSVIRECGKYAGQQRNLEVLGTYDDELVRTPEGWRFARRKFVTKGMHDFATLPAALHEG